MFGWFAKKEKIEDKNDIYYHPLTGLAHSLIDEVMNVEGNIIEPSLFVKSKIQYTYKYYGKTVYCSHVYRGRKIQYQDNYGTIELIYYNDTFTINSTTKDDLFKQNGTFIGREAALKGLISFLWLIEQSNHKKQCVMPITSCK
jgi:hypothetical protein